MISRRTYWCNSIFYGTINDRDQEIRRYAYVFSFTNKDTYRYYIAMKLRFTSLIIILWRIITIRLMLWVHSWPSELFLVPILVYIFCLEWFLYLYYSYANYNVQVKCVIVRCRRIRSMLRCSGSKPRQLARHRHALRLGFLPFCVFLLTANSL